MTEAEKMLLAQRDAAWLEVERLKARLVLAEEALRRLVRHEPWPTEPAAEDDFRAARMLLEGSK